MTIQSRTLLIASSRDLRSACTLNKPYRRNYENGAISYPAERVSVRVCLVGPTVPLLSLYTSSFRKSQKKSWGHYGGTPRHRGGALSTEWHLGPTTAEKVKSNLRRRVALRLAGVALRPTQRFGWVSTLPWLPPCCIGLHEKLRTASVRCGRSTTAGIRGWRRWR